MHHSYLDKYARCESALHNLDARIKLLLSLLTIVLIAIVPRPGSLFLGAILLAILLSCIISRIPVHYLLIRSAVVIPFTGFAVLSYALTSGGQGETLWQWGPFALTDDGLHRGGYLLIRAWIAVSFTIILINTTPFDQLLAAMRFYKVPSVMIILLSFLYRYLYVLMDEVERIQRARSVRYFGGYWKRQLLLLGNIVSVLFLRSYERAERVQMAMQSRGWYGQLDYLQLKALGSKDLIISFLGLIGLITLWMIRSL